MKKQHLKNTLYILSFVAIFLVMFGGLIFIVYQDPKVYKPTNYYALEEAKYDFKVNFKNDDIIGFKVEEIAVSEEFKEKYNTNVEIDSYYISIFSPNKKTENYTVIVIYEIPRTFKNRLISTLRFGSQDYNRKNKIREEYIIKIHCIEHRYFE